MSSPSTIHETRDAHVKHCPECRSDDTRSLTNIYDMAKNYSRSSLSRVAITGGAGFYLDGANVRPTPETLLAAKFPPPRHPRVSWWTLIVVVITAWFFYFCLVTWVGTPLWLAILLALGIIFADIAIQYFVHQQRMAAYKKDYAEWSKQRVCMDCERSFTPVI